MKLSTRKMVIAAMMACLAFVLNTFVYFPAMAPFQHFVNVVAAVVLGPWYGCAAAFVCGILRMMSGRTIQAVVGAVFGPILGGLLYKKFHNVWLVLVGEVIGTGIIGALAAYPLMTWFYDLEEVAWYYYVPFLYAVCNCGRNNGHICYIDFKEKRLLIPDYGRIKRIGE